MRRKKLKTRDSRLQWDYRLISSLARKPISLVSCIFLLISLPVFAAAEETGEDANPFIIKSIEIQGSETMPAETVLGILQTKIGEEVSVKRIRDDVKELFKLGQFSDIQVDSSGSKDGIHVTFILEEWPKVEEVNIEGNDELSVSKIKGALTIAPGRSLSGKLIHENTNKIVSLYQNKGYYLAQVESDVVVNSQKTAKVAFKIEEGKKVKVERIEIIGNRKISDKEIRKQMKIKKGKKFDDDYFEGDLKAIARYYHESGFIDAKLISSGKDFNEDKTGLVVRVELEEGPQFHVGTTHITIRFKEDIGQLFSEKEVLKEFGLKEGDIFSEATFGMAVGQVNKIYLDKGRVSVQIIPDRDYNSAEEVVNFNLEIFEGGPAYIESVPINWISETNDEPHKTKEYVIRRELKRFDIEKGEMFSYQNIEDARRKILTLGPFIRRAAPSAAVSETGDEKVTVNFDIEESRQSGMFSIAGGYGSEGGLFGALDIWDDNVMGRAWRLHLRGEMGMKGRRTGQVLLSSPWIFNTPTSMAFSLYSRRRTTSYYPGEDDEDDRLYQDESIGSSITVGRPITRQIDLSMRLRVEKASSKERISDDVWDEIYDGNIRSIKIIADRDTRQFLTSMFDPKSGSYNTASAEYSGLGGDQFQKYITESSLFIPTWWKLVLVGHVRTGYLGGADTAYMRYERFFLGGMDSVRGYDRYAITPPGGYKEGIVNYYERYGGNKMAQLNIEYRFPITNMLRGLLFFDAGQVWPEGEMPWDNFKPRKSIGIGLRIDLLGALARIEYGYPLDSAQEGGKVESGRIEFDIGPAF